MDGERERRANLRVGDADREQAVAQLRQHHADGRLDLEEFEERMGRAYAAKTFADLAVLLRDLPALPAPAPPVPAFGRPPAPPAARRVVYRHLASFVTVGGMLVAIWALAGGGYFWPLWVLLFWGLGLASHAARAFLFHEEFGDRNRRQQHQRERRRDERQRRYG